MEGFAQLGFAAGVFGGDVFTLHGLEDFADVDGLAGLGHHGEVLEEGDHGDEALVAGLALPFGEDDGVFGLELDVGGVGVDDDDLGGVAVEVGEVLGVLALVVLNCQFGGVGC